ncbi:CatB-related O-acetyltransferase [Marinobacterium litorale]|uniref:CatB-related O-acetyltransferase n=1 Tax=Marinobacterium litorale TaxID=404770 RepID=UPI0012ECB751|nr:CatB-related O-acetyltransferase [Marinobacterium litorale]
MRALLLALKRRRAKKLGVDIGNRSLIDDRVLWLVEPGVRLGRFGLGPTVLDQIRVGAHSYIRSGEVHCLASVGRYCSIGRNVTLGQDGRNHPLDWVSTSHRLSHTHRPDPVPVEIGHDVWVGDGAVIMAGVRVGNGAVIARNAVVTKDVEPYQIVGGNPAKPIRYRFEAEVIAALQNSLWWEYPLPALRDLAFDQPLKFVERLLELSPEKANYPRLAVGQGKVVKKSG